MINGILAPVLLVFVMLAANNRAIMGARVNTPLLNAVGWTTTLVMGLAAIGSLVTMGR